MSDSTVDTNIPVTRLPFGSNIPPKVPYTTADNVGSDTKPVKVVNKQIVPVGGELAPKHAPSFTRDIDVHTEEAVPTSPTPEADDVDSMVATKGYVDTALGPDTDGITILQVAANKLKKSTSNVGGPNTPVYLKGGRIVACEDQSVTIEGNDILVLDPGGTYANTNKTGVGKCTRAGSSSAGYTFTVVPFKNGFLSINFCIDNTSSTSGVNLSISVNGKTVSRSHNYPTNRAGITQLIHVSANDTVVISSTVANPTHAYIYMM